MTWKYTVLSCLWMGKIYFSECYSVVLRKGLAYACGAKLILECIKNGLYPSWDAQNKWSVALAEKLGYHFSHEYIAYEIIGY